MLLSVISLDSNTNLIEDRLVLQKEQIVSHEIVEDFVRYNNQQADEDAIQANIDYINSCEICSNKHGFSIDMEDSYIICTILS